MGGSLAIPLEDELGDVLEKAMQGFGMTVEELAERSRVPAARIRDAIDYRPEFTSAEIRALAAALELNEVGLCALGAGRYPQPEIGSMPFNVWPLRMPHGIGVANAYLVAEPRSSRALLFDTGSGLAALETMWPARIVEVPAVFLTHAEAEHAGGLCEVVARFDVDAAFVPQGSAAPLGRPIGEGERKRFGGLEITAYATPGHAAAHNCYHVRAASIASEAGLLVSGDLVFAGSAGGGYFSATELRAQLRRVLSQLPQSTVIAPGHGPMTTVANEIRFNPFVA